MSRAAQLESLAGYAELREQEAAKRLAASLARIQAKEAELAQLRGYLAEYRQRATVDASDSLRWRNARAFIARLSDAVAHHEAELAKVVAQHRFETERWRESYRRSEALDKAVERVERAARAASERRDQAELDERAARSVHALP